jgi:hypothetical protein
LALMSTQRGRRGARTLNLRCGDFYDRSGLGNKGLDADRQHETGDQEAQPSQQKSRKNLQVLHS